MSSFKTNFRLLLTFICFFSLVGVHAASIEGIVKDDLGQTIPFAFIKIPALNKTVMSDVEGHYAIKSLSPGTYNVESSFTGFITSTKSIILKKNEQATLDFVLKENVTLLDETVIATDNLKTKAQKVEESGFAVNAVEMKEVENQSIQTNDVLDQSAGVRIRQDGGLGSRVRYNINGLSGNSIRIFIDGIPIENYGSSFSLNSIPTSMIERIDVYKGVVPAEFGTDALGGAVNVITKKNAPNTLNTSYSFGSFNTHQWSLNGNYRDSTSGFAVKGSAFYNYSDNNYRVWGNQIYNTNKFGKIEYVEAERFHDTYESAGLKFDAGFTNVSWADQFFIGVLRSGLKKDIQHGATMETVYGNRTSEQTTFMVNTNYAKNDFLVNGLNVSVFGSYSKQHRNVVDTVPYIYNWHGEILDFDGDGEAEKWASGAESGNPTLNEADENKYVLRANAAYQLNKNNSFSVNQLSSYYTRQPYDPLWVEAVKELVDTRYLTKNITGVSYANNSFDEKLKTSLFYKYYSQSVRLKDVQRRFGSSKPEPYEYNKNTKFHGYGVALAYSVLKNFQLTTSAEKAIRMPTSTEVFGNNADAIDPSYEIQPEQSYNANLGFNLGNVRLKENHNFNWSFNLFYRNTVGMIRQVVANEQAETYSFENTDKVLSKGFDSEIRYSYKHKFKVVLGTSVFNARFNQQYDKNGSEYIYYGDRLRNAPYFTLNTNARYTIKNFLQKDSRTSIYYNIGYVHNYFRDWESLGNAGKNVIPAQLVHSTGVAYTFPSQKITLSVDARNIFNEQVFDNWALQKPGRAFYAKINFRLK